MESLDIAIIGAGIIGLSTAYELKKQGFSGTIAILEKEPEVGLHQSKHNSGVIHSGIYYAPNSLKARLCVEGRKLLTEFCRENNIPYLMRPKLIVATASNELAQLETLHRHGQANGVACNLVEPSELSEIEPSVSGIRALVVNDSGVINFSSVCLKLAELLTSAGVTIHNNFTLTAAKRSGNQFELTSGALSLKVKLVINCAGLYTFGH